FPYQEDWQDPRQGRFFWRQQKEEEEKKDAQPKTRFVLEASFTQLGDLQLDGLVTYPEVWLKLRTHQALDTETTAALKLLTTNTLSSLGLTGGLQTETTARFPLDPLSDILKEDPTTLNLQT
ncbi:MAG: hypothetical protein COY40_02480, partial [Alphaproteobacteria bacterium CG_4_10_14_0_8_um_filter_53_9]